MQTKNQQHMDELHFMILYFVVVNYNTFVTTVLLLPLVYLLNAYFLIVEKVKVYIDPETQMPIASDHQAKEISDWLSGCAIMCGTYLVHYYLV